MTTDTMLIITALMENKGFGLAGTLKILRQPRWNLRENLLPISINQDHFSDGSVSGFIL